MPFVPGGGVQSSVPSGRIFVVKSTTLDLLTVYLAGAAGVARAYKSGSTAKAALVKAAANLKPGALKAVGATLTTAAPKVVKLAKQANDAIQPAASAAVSKAVKQAAAKPTSASGTLATKAAPAPSGQVEEGYFIATKGPNAGKIDFSAKRWARAS